jgi:cytochrome c
MRRAVSDHNPSRQAKKAFKASRATQQKTVYRQRSLVLSRVLVLLALSITVADRAKAQGNATAGAMAFVRQCALCHTVGKGEPNRYGPNLFGILDHRAATVAGFKYSPAFKAAASWDWSAEVLESWISSPSQMVPGTTMGVFQGVSERDRDDIVAYLATQR